MNNRNRPIGRAAAKSELTRINALLKHPHLLIGGLAVQQYHTVRNSQDIDLVCNFETAQTIVAQLYNSLDWKVVEKHEDEYRPSFEITHKFKASEVGTIIFGPKISERESYQYIDWTALLKGAKPFRSGDKEFSNILVPQAHALAYTKFVSFLGRRGVAAKIEADLTDFVDLTNHEGFSVSLFYDLLRGSTAVDDITAQFASKIGPYRGILDKSCLQRIGEVLSQSDGNSRESRTEENGVVNSDVGAPELLAWDAITSTLNSLHRRIEVEFEPDMILTMSGPGSIAACYCMSINLRNVPLLVAATFPVKSKDGPSAKMFASLAKRSDWELVTTPKWMIYLPNLLRQDSEKPPKRPRRILIIDDRVISGESQRAVSTLLTSRGFDVRRAAMIASHSATDELHFVGTVREGNYYFPWGSKHGRS
ncbi:MAG: hypothetical protein ABI824_06090 [Acidobacteriota bacterium]